VLFVITNGDASSCIHQQVSQRQASRAIQLRGYGARELQALIGMPFAGWLRERYGWLAIILLSAGSVLFACALFGGAKVSAAGGNGRRISNSVSLRGK